MKTDLPITEKMRDKAQGVLSNHTEAPFVYVTDDLNVFLPEGKNDCQNHVIRKGNRVAIVERGKEDAGSGGLVEKNTTKGGSAGGSPVGNKSHKKAGSGQKKVEEPVPPTGENGQGSSATGGTQGPAKSEEGAGATNTGSSQVSENADADQANESNPGAEASGQDGPSDQEENNASGETSEDSNKSNAGTEASDQNESNKEENNASGDTSKDPNISSKTPNANYK